MRYVARWLATRRERWQPLGSQVTKTSGSCPLRKEREMRLTRNMVALAAVVLLSSVVIVLAAPPTGSEGTEPARYTELQGVVTPTTTTTTTPTEAPVDWEAVLSGYAWGESSERVADLQAKLGVTADGQYGSETRNAHLAAVAFLGVGSVPDAPAAPREALSVSSTPNYDPGDGSRWDQLAKCECGGNWGCNTGNGFGGGLQFMHQRSYSTWLSFGGGEFAPHPWEATREQQIVIAERVLASSGWSAWPGCSRKFGWI